MNPILNLVKRQSQPVNNPALNQDIQGLIQGIKSGKVDPKEKSLELVKGLSVQQRQAIKQILPMFKKVSKVFGTSDKSILNFITSLEKTLQ